MWKAQGLRNQTNNNRHSRRDVHEIDQSKFDDSVQFEDYDSITIQFRAQLRHSNVMFNEISSTPALQRVLSNVHVMTDNISCPTHKFPLRKLDTRLTVLQCIVKQNLTTNHI